MGPQGGPGGAATLPAVPEGCGMGGASLVSKASKRAASSRRCSSLSARAASSLSAIHRRSACTSMEDEGDEGGELSSNSAGGGGVDFFPPFGIAQGDSGSYYVTSASTARTSTSKKEYTRLYRLYPETERGAWYACVCGCVSVVRRAGRWVVLSVWQHW